MHGAGNAVGRHILRGARARLASTAAGGERARDVLVRPVPTGGAAVGGVRRERARMKRRLWMARLSLREVYVCPIPALVLSVRWESRS